MSEVGALVINLQAETAQFREALSKAQAQLDALGGKSQEAGGKLDYSFKESRGGLLLTEEIIGVRLPRELNTLIAGIEGVGAAFAVALPIIGVVAAIAVIAKLVEEHEKLAIAIEKGAEETANLAVKGNDEVATLELQNLRIQDQITKLEGGIPRNGLKEALLEAGIAADKLASSFAASFQSINDELRQTTGFFDNFGTKVTTVAAALASGGGLGVAAAVAGLAATSDAIKKVNKDYEEQKDIRVRLSDAVASGDTKGETSAQVALIASYKTLETDAKTALATINENTELGAKQSTELRQQILGAADAQREFAQQTKNAADSQKLAKLEDTAKANPGMESALEDAKKLADSQYSIAVASAKQQYDQKKITLEDEVALEKDALDKQLAAQIAYYEGKKKIAGTTDAAVASYNTEETLATSKAAAQKTQIDDNYFKTRLGLVKASVSESVAESIKADQQTLQSATQTAANKAEVLKAYAEADKSSLASAVDSGLISRRQELQAEIQLAQASYEVKKASLAKEVADKSAALNAEIAAEQGAAQKILDSNGGKKEDPEYKKYLDDIIAKQIQLNAVIAAGTSASEAATVQLGTTVQNLNSQIGNLYPTWNQFFSKMRQDLPTLQQQMQSSFTQGTNALNEGIAKSIVEGKSLTQALRQSAAQILEQWIQLAAKRLELDLLTTVRHIAGNQAAAASDKESATISQVAAAKAAAAKAYQSLASIPIIGPELGAAAAVATFGFLLAFEQGGTIPGSGAVPIIGHGGETVVTKALTDRVNNSERNGGRSGGALSLNMTFAPNIQALDADGVDRVLAKNQTTFQRHFAAAARRMNR